jgi:hypothetical protein
MSREQCFNAILPVGSLICFDDILHEMVADYVLTVKMDEIQPLDTGEFVLRID